MNAETEFGILNVKREVASLRNIVANLKTSTFVWKWMNGGEHAYRTVDTSISICLPVRSAPKTTAQAIAPSIL